MSGVHDLYPAASHYRFPYYFTDNDSGSPDGSDYQGINFNSYWLYFDGDLLIMYDDMDMPTETYLDCWCSRWDVSNYSFTIETWLTASQAQTLRNNIKPGAVGELYKILGRPLYYDKTWAAENTLRFYPNRYKTYELATQTYVSSASMGNLHKMRKSTLGYVKNVTEHPIVGTDWIEVKLECMMSGSGGL